MQPQHSAPLAIKFDMRSPRYTTRIGELPEVTA
ncbi:MAG: DUF4113 domain-containing protein [Alphaproteobacteria bacterium]|nr:MAG: DUF4113 domain-containing protein [Alphaproteobacteria bacterium]